MHQSNWQVRSQRSRALPRRRESGPQVSHPPGRRCRAQVPTWMGQDQLVWLAWGVWHLMLVAWAWAQSWQPIAEPAHQATPAEAGVSVGWPKLWVTSKGQHQGLLSALQPCQVLAKPIWNARQLEQGEHHGSAARHSPTYGHQVDQDPNTTAWEQWRRHARLLHNWSWVPGGVPQALHWTWANLGSETDGRKRRWQHYHSNP